MPQKLIDQTTIQPDGRPGDDAFTAFSTCNDNFQNSEERLVALERGTGETGGRLDNEIAARTAADAALGIRIDDEATARANAVAAITPHIPGENVIINGDMSVWQRGDIFASAVDARRFTADRWISWTGGGKATQVAPRSMHDAAWLPAFAQSRSRRAMYIAISEAGVADGSFALLQHNVEGVHVLAGGPVTVSFAIWVDKATKIGVGFWQSYDDGGTVNTIDPNIISLAPGWQMVSTTVTLPALSTTRVRGPRNCLNLNIWLAASAAAGSGAPGIGLEGFTMWITNVKLEAGSVATGFRARPAGEELMLSQRYFRSSFAVGEAVANKSLTSQHRAATCFANTSMRVSIGFDTPMRSAPNLRFYSAAEVPNAPDNQWGYYNSAIQTWVAAQATNVVNTQTTGIIIDVGSNNTTPGSVYLVSGQYTADAEI